jgi:hypothetical protein
MKRITAFVAAVLAVTSIVAGSIAHAQTASDPKNRAAVSADFRTASVAEWNNGRLV